MISFAGIHEPSSVRVSQICHRFELSCFSLCRAMSSCCSRGPSCSTSRMLRIRPSSAPGTSPLHVTMHPFRLYKWIHLSADPNFQIWIQFWFLSSVPSLPMCNKQRAVDQHWSTWFPHLQISPSHDGHDGHDHLMTIDDYWWLVELVEPEVQIDGGLLPTSSASKAHGGRYGLGAEERRAEETEVRCLRCLRCGALFRCLNVIDMWCISVMYKHDDIWIRIRLWIWIRICIYVIFCNIM